MMALINTIMYMGGLGLIKTNEGHGWENLIKFLLSFFVMTAARKPHVAVMQYIVATAPIFFSQENEG